MPVSVAYIGEEEGRLVLGLLDKIGPELSCIGTVEEGMVNIFLIVVTELALRRNINSSVVEEATGWDPVVHEEPEKGPCFVRSISFPDEGKVFPLVWVIFRFLRYVYMLPVVKVPVVLQFQATFSSLLLLRVVE